MTTQLAAWQCLGSSVYERSNRELARVDWKYMQNYADAKTAVVEEILARAQGAAGDEAREDS